jgi:queuine tRNA-ribosyltransferase
MSFDFKYTEYKSGRCGTISTPHGQIQTPTFINCATFGGIKSVPTTLLPENLQILLVNTFHLQKYTQNIKQCGGIHQFMNWNKPIIADSGGYQIFSMGYGCVSDEIKGKKNTANQVLQISEEQCTFCCKTTGQKSVLSSEISIQIQIDLGVDFIISFDECTPFNCSKNYTQISMERSHRWEQRSLDYYKKNANQNQQAIYSIVQGGVYDDLRTISSQFCNNLDTFGICIGGSLGKNPEQMHEIVKFTRSQLRNDKPIHLLGIGTIKDLVLLSPYIDTFDCVEITRLGRHGTAVILPNKKLKLSRSIFQIDHEPIDKNCQCFTCKNFTKSYIHHLLKTKDTSAGTLLSIHNIFTIQTLMQHIRTAISSDNYSKFLTEFIL